MDKARILLATTLVPDDRKVLACVRALAGAGQWVAVASDRHFGEASYSRYVRRRLRYPHPGKQPNAFLESLNEQLRLHRIDVLLPMNDYTTLALSALRDKLPGDVRMALAAHSSLLLAKDKEQTLALAQSLRMDTPKTSCARSAEEVFAAAESIGFPCVVKPNSGSGAVGMSIVKEAGHLQLIYQTSHPKSDAVFDYDRLLVQEYLPGDTCDVCVICRHGEVCAALTQRRRWMHPYGGGMGVSVEVTEEPKLIEQAARILRALRWHGPAVVEFRMDQQSGRVSLMEINGRLGGSSDAGIHGGVNYPLLWTELALKGEVPPVENYRVGMRFRWPIPFALLALKSASLREVVQEFLMPAPNTHCDLKLRDPLPHLAEAFYAAQRFASGFRRPR